MKNLLYILIICLASVSCEKEIEMDLPTGPDRISMDARIFAGDSISVLVGTSASVLSAQSPTADQKNEVLLYRGDTLVDTLKPRSYFGFESEIFRYYSRLVAEENQGYRLVAKREGFESASAEDQTGSSVSIENWQHDQSEQRIRFEFQDPPNQDDFYMLEILLQRNNSDPELKSLSSFDPKLEMLYSDDDLLSGPVNSGLKAILNDDGFDGQLKEITLYYNNDINIGEEHILRFSHISRNFYLYERSRSAQRLSEIQLFAEGSNLYSNVKNGYGSVVFGSSDLKNFIP